MGAHVEIVIGESVFRLGPATLPSGLGAVPGTLPSTASHPPHRPSGLSSPLSTCVQRMEFFSAHAGREFVKQSSTDHTAQCP